MKIRLQLVKCGRCGKPKGNPLTHVCVTRLDKPRKPGKTKLKPKLSVTVRCPKCRKNYTNPVTHVCVIKTDFKKRLAASKKKPAARKPEHRHASCKDEGCQRQACVGYKDGYEDGYANGAAAGA